VTPHGLIRLSIAEKITYREQLHPKTPTTPNGSTARGGQVLVISGDTLINTGTSLDIRDAAALGTLASAPRPSRPDT
jgi:hypothetical protein